MAIDETFLAFDVAMEPAEGSCVIPPSFWNPSIDEYHLHPAMSSSSLKLFRQDRAEFQREKVWGWAPKTKSRKSKNDRSMDIGGAFGGYFLDADEYAARIAKLGKDDRAIVAAMVASIVNAPMDLWAGHIYRYLTTPAGRSEWSYLFCEPTSGRICRARYDRLIGFPGERPRILNIEVKTSWETTPFGWRKQIRKLEYYNQLALQEQGLRIAFPWAEIESRWAFISTTAPYRSAILRPDDAALSAAVEQNQADLRELQELMERPHEPWGHRRLDWELSENPQHA